MDDALVYFVFGACAVFVVGYSILARGWWRTRVGLAMGLRDIVIVFILLPEVFHVAFGVTLAIRWFHWYWRVSWLALGLVSLWRLRVIWSVQRRPGSPLSLRSVARRQLHESTKNPDVPRHS